MRTGLRQQSIDINVSSLLIVIAESITTFSVTQNDVYGNEALDYLGFCCPVALSCWTLWTASRQAFLSFTICQSLLKLMSIESVMSSNISSSVIPFSSCLQSFPSSGSFLMSWLFASGGQSIGASTSTPLFPMNIQGWFPLDWVVWSPCSPRDSQVSSPTPWLESISSSVLSLLYGPTLTSTHDYWKNHSLTIQTFVGQVISLVFNMLFIIAFLQRSKYLLIS